MSVDTLINNLFDLLNESDGSVKTTELSNELLETLKTIENCTSCIKDEKINGKELDKCLVELEKEQIWTEYRLNDELNKIDFELNKEILCEGCKGKKIEKLTDKCGNEEMARLLHECKLNAKYYNDEYIRWIPFDEFKNIQYLAKGGFGEVHKAAWIGGYYGKIGVVLKRIYNSGDKIIDLLKEVK